MFGRKKKNRTDEDTAQEVTADATTPDASDAEGPGDTDAPAASSSGPQDFAAAGGTDGRVDLGSIFLTPAPGTELRLEVDQASNDVTAVQVADDQGAMQIQVFAAPRSAGIWDDIRGEISEMISGNGGTVEEVSGPFGTELRTRLAQPGPQGRTVFAPAVFAGTDGPRWFLRAVYSGAAAVDEQSRATFDEVLRSVVVSRGDEPRAPREMLPLRMPTASEPEAPAQDAAGDDLKPFGRGPEITEVR